MPSNIAELVNLLLQLLSLAIIIRAVLSFIDPQFRSAFARIIVDMTEPILGPFRRVIPPAGAFDLSPIVAILAVQLINVLLQRALTS
jgi:YggT family protein